MKEKLTMNEWPITERPYEKMEKEGSGSLSDAELIAVLLSSGMNGKTSIDLAMELLYKFENLGFLNLAGLEELQTVPGIGRVKAIRLRAAIELGKRINHFVANEVKVNLDSSQNAIAYFNNRLQYLPREEFHVALLNVKQRLIRSVQVATGDIKSIQIDAREIFREAIKSNASGIILAHNHPSGDATPSQEDLTTTKRIAKLGYELNIQVLDHIIVATQNSISLKSAGYF